MTGPATSTIEPDYNQTDLRHVRASVGDHGPTTLRTSLHDMQRQQPSSRLHDGVPTMTPNQLLRPPARDPRLSRSHDQPAPDRRSDEGAQDDPASDPEQQRKDQVVRRAREIGQEVPGTPTGNAADGLAAAATASQINPEHLNDLREAVRGAHRGDATPFVADDPLPHEAAAQARVGHLPAGAAVATRPGAVHREATHMTAEHRAHVRGEPATVRHDVGFAR